MFETYEISTLLSHSLLSSRMSRDFLAHLGTFSDNNSHSKPHETFIMLSHSCCLFFFFELLLKDSVKGVLTVAPGGESLPHCFNNICGSNNARRLNGIDGSQHPVASADIYSPLSLVPPGWMVMGRLPV